MKYAEEYKRSVLKTISWRVVATLATMMIVFLFTKRIALSIGVGAVEVFSKMVLYFVHERCWGRIRWGRKIHPLSEIDVSENVDTGDVEIIRAKLRDLGYLQG